MTKENEVTEDVLMEKIGLVRQLGDIGKVSDKQKGLAISLCSAEMQDAIAAEAKRTLVRPVLHGSQIDIFELHVTADEYEPYVQIRVEHYYKHDGRKEVAE